MSLLLMKGFDDSAFAEGDRTGVATSLTMISDSDVKQVFKPLIDIITL